MNNIKILHQPDFNKYQDISKSIDDITIMDYSSIPPFFLQNITIKYIKLIDKPIIKNNAFTNAIIDTIEFCKLSCSELLDNAVSWGIGINNKNMFRCKCMCSDGIIMINPNAV